MKEYLKKLFHVAIMMTIFIGLPYMIGDWLWLWFSWIPAVAVISYLEQ